ncbi:MAG TPA: hypothetical protein VNO55_31665 [Polyangia bacterium]|nr:hypothetical protein [Polyangia bacterium]
MRALRGPRKRFTRARLCDTEGCPSPASFLAKGAPGRGGRVQLCWLCAIRTGKVELPK